MKLTLLRMSALWPPCFRVQAGGVRPDAAASQSATIESEGERSNDSSSCSARLDRPGLEPRANYTSGWGIRSLSKNDRSATS